MTKKKTQPIEYTVPVVGVSFAVLLILKVTRVVAWSWWLILLPIWVTLALFLAEMFLFFVPKLVVLWTLRLATLRKRRRGLQANKDNEVK